MNTCVLQLAGVKHLNLKFDLAVAETDLKHILKANRLPRSSVKNFAISQLCLSGKISNKSLG